jgi:multidrug resistance efflux pump
VAGKPPGVVLTDEASDDVTAPAPAPKADPVRRATYIVIVLLLALLVINIATDQLAPITLQTTAETLVVPVTPKVAGEIIDVPVKDNSRVVAGQLLAVIDPTDYRTALETARAQQVTARQSVASAVQAVESARAVVVSRKALLLESEQQNDRTKALVKAGFATLSRLDTTMATVAANDAGVRQAEAQLASAIEQLGPTGEANPQLRAAAAAVKLATDNLAYTRVTAPVSGYLSNLRIGAGSYAVAGQPLISLIDVRTAALIGYFNENQLTNMRLGDRVQIALSVAPGKLFTGHVAGMGGGVATANQQAPLGSLVQSPSTSWLDAGQRLPVRIEFDNFEGLPYGLRLGSQASVMVLTANAGIIGKISHFLLLVRSYLDYIG